MTDYVERYEKALKFYQRGEYAVALELFATLPRRGEIPQEKRWSYHQAMAMCLLWCGYVEASLNHWEAVWKEPGDMPRANLIESYSNYLMYLHYIDGISDEKMRTAHFHYQDFFARQEQFSHEGRKCTQKKLRIGYLSPDIVDHIVTNFTVQLLALHNRDDFEVFLYNIGERTNEVTDWLYSMADGGQNLCGLPFAEAAGRIYEDKVDILVDLSGHCAGGKTLQIAAYKPAPVQVCGIGYFDTTGLSAMDYVLGDIYCDPPGQEIYFREKIICLPHSHLCYTPSERFAADFPPYRVHKSLTFGSFNNFAKITDQALLAWKTILEKLPDSRLLLKNVHPIMETLNGMKQKLRKMNFPMDRVEIRPGSFDYLRDYEEVDIILDTYPYTGGGTTCEALYLGIPVINRYGSRHGSRFSYSLLHNTGLGDLSVASWEEYIAKAVALAEVRILLQNLHEQIPAMFKSSSVMDGKSYVQDVEQAYREIWQIWCNG